MTPKRDESLFRPAGLRRLVLLTFALERGGPKRILGNVRDIQKAHLSNGIGLSTGR